MKDLSAITILKNVFQKQLTVPVQPDRIPVGAFAVLLVKNVVSVEAKNSWSLILLNLFTSKNST